MRIAAFALLFSCTTDVPVSEPRPDAGSDAGFVGDAASPCDGVSCDDGVFCNGLEACDPSTGRCGPARAPACDDGDACTLDACDEAAGTCSHDPRDADLDGEVDGRCESGTDCDDLDPAVGSTREERCGTGLDEDCDDGIDESVCSADDGASCASPRAIALVPDGAPTTVTATAVLAGASPAESSCHLPDDSFTDPSTQSLAVFSFELAARSRVAIESQTFATTEMAPPMSAVEVRRDCESPSYAGCESADYETESRTFQELVLEPGEWTIFVRLSRPERVDLQVSARTDIAAPAHDRCASPADVSAGGTFTGTFTTASDDEELSCGSGGLSDVAYRLVLDRPRDVAIALTGDAVRSSYGSWTTYAISLRRACTDDADIVCASDDEGTAPADFVRRSLPAGTYFVIAEGDAGPFELEVELSEPTPPLAGEDCASPIALTPGVPVTSDTTGATIDVTSDCISGFFRSGDIVYSLELAARSDVDIEVASGITSIFTGGLSSTCPPSGEVLPQCLDSILEGSADTYIHARGLAAGTHYLVVTGLDVPGEHTVTATVRPPGSPTAVTGNETCATARVVGATGGYYRARATRSDLTFPAYEDPYWCDNSTPESAYRLDLTARRRVFASATAVSDGTPLGMDLFIGSCERDTSRVCGYSTIGVLLDPGTYYFVVESELEHLVDIRVEAP